jgi:hypothetical protein
MSLLILRSLSPPLVLFSKKSLNSSATSADKPWRLLRMNPGLAALPKRFTISLNPL